MKLYWGRLPGESALQPLGGNNLKQAKEEFRCALGVDRLPAGAKVWAN